MRITPLVCCALAWGGFAAAQAPLDLVDPKTWEDPPANLRAVDGLMPAAPDVPALFEVRHKHYRSVQVTKMEWPVVKVEAEQRCDVMFWPGGESGLRMVAEECPEELYDPVLGAMSKWRMRVSTYGKNQDYARFRGTFVFRPGQGAMFEVNSHDVVGDLSSLPDRVRAVAQLKLDPRYVRAPKPPKGGVTEPQACAVTVQVDRRGRGDVQEVAGCDDAYADQARKVVSKYRWVPPVADEPYDRDVTTLRVRFSP